MEVIGREGVGVALAKVEEMFSEVLRLTAEVVSVVGLVPGEEEYVPTRTVVGGCVVPVGVVLTVASVDAPAGLEETAVVILEPGLEVSVLVM